jgi:hypothetical protein
MLQVDALLDEKCLQLLAERILAEPTDQRGRGAGFRRRHRLVGALAAGKELHRAACDGLANLGKPRRAGDDVHVDTAGDQHAHGYRSACTATTRT